MLMWQKIEKRKKKNQNCCVKRDITCENYKFYTGGWKHDKHAKIIVFENDNRNLIREYRRDSGSHYYCYGCKRATNIRNRGILKNQIFTVPFNHVCEPVNFDLFEKEQKEYEAKGPSHHHYPPPKTSEKQIRKARLRAYRERCRTRAMSCLPVWLTTTSEPPNKIARIVEE
uniref:Site-specific DNA endonuclease n=1 Tax=Panagrolaimus superbus TaxID=310955 RepID=A0A914Y9C5_9BILA